MQAKKIKISSVRQAFMHKHEPCYQIITKLIYATYYTRDNGDDYYTCDDCKHAVKTLMTF